MMLPLGWIALSFLLGALPFSVWIGRWALQRDITAVGDHNPGATNVLRSGGVGWFVLALILDIAKAAAPVGVAAQLWQWNGWQMWAVAMAPPLGHAFSPFLRFRGGKAVAAAFGVWIGLTLWTMPVVALLSLLFWFTLQTSSGWAIILTLLTMLGALAIWQPDPLLLGVAAGQLALMIFTHRADLTTRPRLAPFWWVKKLAAR